MVTEAPADATPAGLPNLAPWLVPVLRGIVERQQAHALLLHGVDAAGPFDVAREVARAWLCEGPDATRPCGRCAACRLVPTRAHPDLRFVVPEALAVTLGWSELEGDNAAGAPSKAKPSKDIKVDAVRGAITFAQTTTARGRAKVVVLHPAERMNAVSANTLLKTLEEPPGAARFILVSAAPDALLPTVRSRCQAVALALPPVGQATAWLVGQGVDAGEAAVLLAAVGGEPRTVLEWLQEGIDAAAWCRLPEAVMNGNAAVLTGWPLPRAIDALFKLAHDAACVGAGAKPRYFPPATLPPAAEAARVQAWLAELRRAARHAEHPWNAGLLVESLVQQGRQALGATVRLPR